ncbi:MAG: DUF3656 domain-containing protein [Prevotella sp.]|nr:DUF3656 domain-containing protein [Prevotella sp.]
MTTLELLAPARNLECGIAAIDHGADAVYVGAGKFGARVAAGNSIDDIRALCQYAHRFQARVYVTVNTIVYDNELDEVRQLVAALMEAGADALLVQDMALVDIVHEEEERQGKSLPLHASTQTDNRSAAKVAWLATMGFRRVVLARELSLREMAEIHRQVPQAELEAFVHGALCVSYSGQCYASQYCFRRSANRGECAQFCRLKFDLVDADGQRIGTPCHWLSLKDMCRIDRLEEMAAAGICSFKIEGRLKDVAYVKNVVAAYSQALDGVVARSGGRYRRASLGSTRHLFKPDLRKTFNRGFTGYFIDGTDDGIASPYTPKALGEYVGKVKEVRRDSFNVAGLATFANGDGLCFFDHDRQLQGFRVNRVEGNRIYPQQMPRQLKAGTALYRNADAAMDRLLAKTSAERRIALHLWLNLTESGLRLTAQIPEAPEDPPLSPEIPEKPEKPESPENPESPKNPESPDPPESPESTPSPLTAQAEVDMPHEPARQSQEENIRRQLSRLGNTAYEATQIMLGEGVAAVFIPSSLLADLRRQVVATLDKRIPQASGKTEKPVSSRNPGKPGISGNSGLSGDPEKISLSGNPEEAPITTTPSSSVCGDSIATIPPPAYQHYAYLYNVANAQAREVYSRQGIDGVGEAFELSPRSAEPALLMRCRHCIRRTLGCCTRDGHPVRWREPLWLVLPDQRRFRLQFDCRKCEMLVFSS